MAESSAPIQASTRSGEPVRQVGPYRSNARIPIIAFFNVGDRPPGDAENKQLTWTLLADEKDPSSETQL
jgi:hypothetical protein